MGTAINRDKIGNLMIYLSQHVPKLYHTKLLKLLFLIDQEAVKENGVPVTWLDYKVWVYGPVPESIYQMVNSINCFESFVKVVPNRFGNKIVATSDFCDDEFSDDELSIIDRVIAAYGNRSSEDLVNITHEDGGLWDRAKMENDIDFSDGRKISDVSIDFKRIIDSKEKLDNYKGAYDTQYFNYSLTIQG